MKRDWWAAARQSGHVSSDIAYRPDIDGLRAIAVALVVLSHAGVTWLPGGFVGVDVFFVISGFLITALIAAQREQGSFRFGDFYLRRAKRLLPALYATMLATLAAGYWFLVPSDYSALAKSALWAVGLTSNVFFAGHTGGYFSPDASAFPLLHVWSLSAEEQFYLLWPAALLLILRLSARRAAVAGLAAASFLYAQYAAMTDPTGAYFLLPSRAGEFLVGALVFMFWREREAPRPLGATLLALAGVALIAASALTIGDTTPFPGLTALAPCLGAALVIAAPQFGPSPVSRVLASPPFVAVGLISYSVYLWHWPIVSYLKVSGVALGPLVTAAVVAASLALGAVSWIVFERGYRQLLDRKQPLALIGAALATAALIAGPALLVVRQGLPERFPYAMLTETQLTAERDRYWREVGTKTPLKAGEAQRQLLIIGNSHAYDLAYALKENEVRGRIKIVESSYECFNFGHDPVTEADRPYCSKRVLEILAKPDIRIAEAIYLHDHWAGYDEAGMADMIARIRAISKAPIYVFGPKMTFSQGALDIARQAQRDRHATVAGVNRYAERFYEPEKIERDRRLKAFFANYAVPNVRYISTLDVECGPKRRCDVLSPEGRFLYFDRDHLTLDGARRLGQRLKAAHPEVF